MTVGQLAERSGIPAKTLRYYDEIGLLTPRRNASGWRSYDEGDLVVLQLTAVGKRLGMELEEITRFVRLFQDPQLPNDDLVRALEPHQRRLDQEIRLLQEAQVLLKNLVTACPLRRC